MKKSAVWLADFLLHAKTGYNFYRRLKPFFLFRVNLQGLTSALFFFIQATWSVPSSNKVSASGYKGCASGAISQRGLPSKLGFYSIDMVSASGGLSSSSFLMLLIRSAPAGDMSSFEG